MTAYKASSVISRGHYTWSQTLIFSSILYELYNAPQRGHYGSNTQPVIVDLILWYDFLNVGLDRKHINNLVYQKPSHFCWVDSWSCGIRGYSAKIRGWCFYIPLNIWTPNTNNVQEYITSNVYIWVDMLENNLPPLAWILCCSDSSSTVRWIHRNNFHPSAQSSHELCSRKLAPILLKANRTLYPHHQTEKHNNIANILSLWNFISNI